MTYYHCEICKFNTKIKSHIIRHHATKKHIRNIINTNLLSCDGKYTKMEHKKSQKEPQKSQKEPKRAAKEPEYSCDHCFENFKTYANKRRHELHRCQKFKSIGNLCTDKDKIIDILYQKELNHDKEKKNLYKQIDKLIDKAGNTTHIETTSTNIQNIRLNNYGNEDLSHITDKMKTDLLEIPYCAIPKMIEAVHFDFNKPENKNIVLANKNDNKIKIFNGIKWIYKNKEETINDLVDGKYFILDSYYETVCDQLTNNRKNSYEQFRIDFDEHNDKLIKNLKDQCELLLLNNR